MAQDPPPSSPRPARLDRGEWYGRALIVIGVILIVASTLTLTSAGYGTQIKREFSQRRSYDMIKPDVHRALPRVILLGLGGLVVILIGAQFRRGSGQGRQDPD